MGFGIDFFLSGKMGRESWTNAGASMTVLQNFASGNTIRPASRKLENWNVHELNWVIWNNWSWIGIPFSGASDFYAKGTILVFSEI